MGIVLGQVARLTAVGAQPGPQQSPTDPAVPPTPCLVTLGFVDASGSPVGKQPGPTQIDGGRAAFLDLPASDLVRTFGQRVHVRPVVQVDSVPGMAACPGVVAAVETIDVFVGRTWAVASPEKNPGPNQ